MFPNILDQGLDTLVVQRRLKAADILRKVKSDQKQQTCLTNDQEGVAPFFREARGERSCIANPGSEEQTDCADYALFQRVRRIVGKIGNLLTTERIPQR